MDRIIRELPEALFDTVARIAILNMRDKLCHRASLTG
jgi:hypothetical protein